MFQVEQGHRTMICSADTTTRPISNVGTFTTMILGGELSILFSFRISLVGLISWPVGQEPIAIAISELID